MLKLYDLYILISEIFQSNSDKTGYIFEGYCSNKHFYTACINVSNLSLALSLSLWMFN
jgi:hypothetical protein